MVIVKIWELILAPWESLSQTNETRLLIFYDFLTLTYFKYTHLHHFTNLKNKTPFIYNFRTLSAPLLLSKLLFVNSYDIRFHS